MAGIEPLKFAVADEVQPGEFLRLQSTSASETFQNTALRAVFSPNGVSQA
jgi:hypothetical protein